jgi:hypothetical protein
MRNNFRRWTVTRPGKSREAPLIALSVYYLGSRLSLEKAHDSEVPYS